jgi:ribosome-associated toxin RatA of RatAB toxin-antitoxin module
MREISRSAIVGHSAARLYALVEDVAAYPRFLPWCLAAEVKERSDNTMLARLEVGMRALRQSFTTRTVSRPGESIHIALVEGPFRAFNADWHFTPLGDAACKIEFRLAFEFSSRAAAASLGPLFEHIADTMVDAFTRRAEALHGDDTR